MPCTTSDLQTAQKISKFQAIKLIYINSLLDIQKTLVDNNTFITLFLSQDYTSADNLKDDNVFQQNTKLLSESV